jgi:RNA-directed DNA polymerase
MSAAATLAGAAPGTVPDWHAIHWRKVWHNVRRLQARIVKATQEGRWGKVHALVYLLTHSFSGRAAAIVRVTTNQGASTPGVDGEVWDSPELKAVAFSSFADTVTNHSHSDASTFRKATTHPSFVLWASRPWPTVPCRRSTCLVSIRSGKRLPMPTPTAFAVAAAVRTHWINVTRFCGKNHSATWILEGDIKACFDRIEP